MSDKMRQLRALVKRYSVYQDSVVKYMLATGKPIESRFHEKIGEHIARCFSADISVIDAAKTGWQLIDSLKTAYDSNELSSQS